MTISNKETAFSLENYQWGSKRNEAEVGGTISQINGVLKVKFTVREKELRRMISKDNGKVWTDSCVEVFIKGDGEEYSNFEFSASSHFLACHGRGRNNRTYYSEEERKAISCHVTILENNNKTNLWTCEISIDLIKLGLISKTPAKIAFNLYKCGDELKSPHYISLFAIDGEKPDFHRPDCFGEGLLV